MHPTAGPPMATARRPKSADGSHTRPLRSSPLARPALNRPLASPTLTSPDDQLIITTPPLCHVPNPKSCQCPGSCDSCSASPAASRRRSSGPITAGLRGSGRTQSLYLPSTSDSGRARTVAAVPPEWEIDSLQSLITSRAPKSSHLRPRSSSGIVSSFRPPIPIVEEEVDWQVESDSAQPSAFSSTDTSRNSSTSEITHPRSASQDNSWYTANTYEVTPRFSRLGLAASSVVMPLSQKEHRRLSKNTSLARTNTTTPTTRNSNSTSNTGPTPKHFFIPPRSQSSKSPPTRISLQPPQPSPPPLSRSNSTSNSSETSSIASTSRRQTPTRTSTSISAPSLTRSRSSVDSISTSYESWPPTPLLDRDLVLPAQKDGEESEKDNEHAQIDITITVSSHGDATLPNETIEQSNTPIHSDPQPKPALPQQATLQTPTFPKDIKKGQCSLRKTLVRIKLQPEVDVDDLSSSFSTDVQKTASMATMTPALEVGKVAVGLQVPEAVVSVSAATVGDSQDTLVPVPTPTLKKKPSSAFRRILKCIGRW